MQDAQTMDEYEQSAAHHTTLEYAEYPEHPEYVP
jgi:hypothetical protein